MKTNRDHLENFVNENRTAFDSELPSDKAWKHIDSNLALNPVRHSRHDWLWKAAAVIFFASSVYLYFASDKNLPTNQYESVVATTDEFNNTEAYYTSLISEKKNQIFDYIRRNTDVDEGYQLELQNLDAMYQVLKKEYERNPNADIQDAMTLNLLIRIDILNQQLSDIEGRDQRKKVESEV